MVEMKLLLDLRIVQAFFQRPTECSTMVAVAWLRENMKKIEVDNLCWADTKIMIADGLTKPLQPPKVRLMRQSKN